MSLREDVDIEVADVKKKAVILYLASLKGALDNVEAEYKKLLGKYDLKVELSVDELYRTDEFNEWYMRNEVWRKSK